jgi:hypothetical protein
MLQCCAHLGRSRRGAPQEQPPSRPAQGRRDASEPPGPCLWGQFRPFRPPNGPRCGFSLRGMAAGSNLPRAWRPHVFGCDESAARGAEARRAAAAAAAAAAGAAAQRRWLELRTLRLGDGSLLLAGARDTVRACGGVARLSELRVRGAPLLSAQLIHVVTTGELARKSAGLSCGIGRLVASCRRNCA